MDTPESELTVTIKKEYSYFDSQNENTRYGDQTLTLGKLVILNPDQ